MSEPPSIAGESFILADRITGIGRLAGDEILGRFLDWLAQEGIEPYPAQEEAFLELAAGHHVVLSTPTGSGKSLVAVALHFKAMCEGKRSFYTAPTKALVSEKFFALCEDFGPENVGMLTGDASINVDAPILCCTAEILSNMALRRGREASIPYVVMDEFHYYADRDRGVAWQAPLLVLPDTTFLLLSATLGDMSRIIEDIERRTGRIVTWVHSEDRPVPLDFEYAETTLHETVERLLADGLAPIYVVSFTQREAADLAQALTSARIADRDERERIREAIGSFRFDTPYGKDMRRFLGSGIGVHHAGLLPTYRLLVEQLSQRGLLKVISGTDTLGVGVNIPIRTVLFTKLAKFDGQKVGLLRVRDFKQIAGRAGRKGFDARGAVVCQAPEHVIQARRRREKSGKRKPVARAPRKAAVSWNRQTFERLIHGAPEPLESCFRITHDLAVSVLRGALERGRASPYAELIELIDASHELPRRKRWLRREAAMVFRSLRQGDIVELVAQPGRAGRSFRMDVNLQWNFSLLQNLSLYLVDAVSCLDPAAEDYALDILALVEAIIEDPRAILYAQIDRLKRDLVAQLKAEGIPFEERIRLLDEVRHPEPACIGLIRETFEIFRRHHPWVRSNDVHPKAIARELFETYSSFGDFVRLYRLERFEGVLLRYLGQVFTTLAQGVPESAKTDDVYEMLAFFRTMVEGADKSLVQEWEQLMSGGVPLDGADEVEPVYDLARDDRAVRARVRAELHRLVKALSQRSWEEAVACVRGDPEDSWDPRRFEAALEPYFEAHGQLRFDHRARHSEFTLVERVVPRRWKATQRLLDPDEESVWYIEVDVDLRGDEIPDGPIIRLVEISH
jgi:hypothetical protein